MKKLLAVALAVFMTACCTINLNTKQDKQEPVWNPDSAYASVAKVVASGDAGSISGTGFAIDEDNLLTAGHFCMAVMELSEQGLVSDNISMEIYDLNKNLITFDGLKIKAVDPMNDICMLTLPDHGLKPVVFASTLPQVHEPAIIVGAPNGMAFTVSTGIVVIRDISFGIMAQHKFVADFSAASGNSGSPVFDKNGNVIGMLVMGDETFDKTSICTSVKYLSIFIHIAEAM